MDSASARIRSLCRVLEMKSSGSDDVVKVLVADICAVVQDRVSRCPAFGSLLRESIRKSPDHKLNLILYHDAAIPGNVLASQPKRKSTLIYCSFIELGDWLSKTYSWITIGVVKDSTLSLIEDGTSSLMRSLVKLLCAQGGLLQSGLTFSVDGATWLLQIRQVALIADEAALKATFSNKGASGLRCCLLCQNVLRTAVEIRPPFVHLSECNHTAFQKMSDSDVFLLADNLTSMKERGETSTAFNLTQKVSGLTYAPNGLLWDKEVRGYLGPNQANFDPMHIYFSNGILGSEARMLFQAVDALHKQNKCAVASQDFVTFAKASWWISPPKPSVLNSYPSQREAAATLALKDKASASQMLSMLPLLDCFARTSLQTCEALKLKLDSFLKLCSAVRSVRRAKEAPFQSDADILQLQKKHLEAFVLAWGRAQVRPKHHYQFHLGQQTLTWGAMLDCWCTERKHKDFKKAASLIGRNDVFESSMLTKLLLHEEQLMIDQGFGESVKENFLTFEGRSYYKGMTLLFLSEQPQAFVVKGFSNDGGTYQLHGEAWQLAPVAAFILPIMLLFIRNICLATLHLDSQVDQVGVDFAQSWWESPRYAVLNKEQVKVCLACFNDMFDACVL